MQAKNLAQGVQFSQSYTSTGSFLLTMSNRLSQISDTNSCSMPIYAYVLVFIMQLLDWIYLVQLLRHSLIKIWCLVVNYSLLHLLYLPTPPIDSRRSSCSMEPLQRFDWLIGSQNSQFSNVLEQCDNFRSTISTLNRRASATLKRQLVTTRFTQNALRMQVMETISSLIRQALET